MKIYRGSFLLTTIAPCVFALSCKYGKWGVGEEESEEYNNLSLDEKIELTNIYGIIIQKNENEINSFVSLGLGFIKYGCASFKRRTT